MIHHNVSVRLNDDDYKQLLFLHDKFNRMSYGKVSLADVLRLSVKELYLIESKEQNKPVTTVKTYEVIEQIKEEEKQPEQPLETVSQPEIKEGTPAPTEQQKKQPEQNKRKNRNK